VCDPSQQTDRQLVCWIVLVQTLIAHDKCPSDVHLVICRGMAVRLAQRAVIEGLHSPELVYLLRRANEMPVGIKKAAGEVESQG
jgi:hypothetical protein